jgi:hypothetical protein
MSLYHVYESNLHLACLLAIGWFLFRLSRLGRRVTYLPPGPRTIPILGNAHLMLGVNLHKK